MTNKTTDELREALAMIARQDSDIVEPSSTDLAAASAHVEQYISELESIILTNQSLAEKALAALAAPQDDGLRERIAELIDREYGSFTCSMPNKEARELALEVTDMLLALLPQPPALGGIVEEIDGLFEKASKRPWRIKKDTERG